MCLQLLLDGFDIPNEYPGVPQELPAVDKHLCQFFAWLLRKGLDVVRDITVNAQCRVFVHLYIAVGCLCPVWFDPEGDQHIV
ncbi:hypothetical protein SDC9_122850 [bioreactor metagenome]|uniref:Uncharacterized protein n=1 Tax=bioreactor metagenome TaxID=1076179 RepID=A0A645CFT1_9ZZZZ